MDSSTIPGLHNPEMSIKMHVEVSIVLNAVLPVKCYVENIWLARAQQPPFLCPGPKCKEVDGLSCFVLKNNEMTPKCPHKHVFLKKQDFVFLKYMV